eukprot:TRINITY_DN6686_c0_g1_i1.p1 TRINITY_DN6686_c0_g1~~TRINITY_DN6686_c0_g1_i1.p1  ORF type:complete len:415 (-),score=91.51 TRINITY_DN6686_c0_g1_i1:117-1361(-)
MDKTKRGGRIQGRGWGGSSNRGGRSGFVYKDKNTKVVEKNGSQGNESSTPTSSTTSNEYKYAHLVVHSKKSPYDVYIGRPGPYGNPFKIGPDGDREEVISKYRDWVTTSEEGKLVLAKAMIELPGKVLACWCSPEHCHGHVLAELVNDASSTSLTLKEPTATTPKPKFNTSNYTILQDGLVLIKNALTLAQQQYIVDQIIKFGRGEVEGAGSFYGEKITRADGYVDPDPADSDPSCGRLNLGTKARMNIPFSLVPSKIWDISSEILENSRELCPSIPEMNPTVFRVNYYTRRGQIGWHYDRHPNVSLDMQHTVVSPVISVSLGNSCTFDYRIDSKSSSSASSSSSSTNPVISSNSDSEPDFKSLVLNSGDILIFGGPSRMIVHRVIKIHATGKPAGLNMSEFSSGRLNYAFYDN